MGFSFHQIWQICGYYIFKYSSFLFYIYYASSLSSCSSFLWSLSYNSSKIVICNCLNSMHPGEGLEGENFIQCSAPHSRVDTLVSAPFWLFYNAFKCGVHSPEFIIVIYEREWHKYFHCYLKDTAQPKLMWVSLFSALNQKSLLLVFQTCLLPLCT